MLRIGLTGGIGSGKSTVAKIFELLGVPVYYADETTKDLYHTNKDLKNAMLHHFGDAIYKNEKLDRQQLARIVFNDPEKLQLLNHLVHPLTILDAEAWMKKQKAPYIIKEAAILFESGSAAGLDQIIGVSAPLALRMLRVIKRDQLSREQVLKRMEKQLDESIKMKLCDHIIQNDEQQLVIPQVVALHEKFLKQ
ncbi:MAG: dephospho-CoA kinase [Flavisolibacter sp.]|jgi:dephospho-CoA kinase|nr:dephospho-CoA kinase [Flavisolibacter sp.]